MKLSELKGEPEACEEEQKEELESTVVRKRTRRSAASDGGEGKVRGHRQRDFDPSAEEEEAEPLESRERAESAVWTQNQQKLLELALQQFPRGSPERWDRIAKVVPGKTKVRTETLSGLLISSFTFTSVHEILQGWMETSLKLGWMTEDH